MAVGAASAGAGTAPARPPTAAVPQAAAGELKWRLSAGAQPGNDLLSDVVATGRREAWAVGGQEGATKYTPLVYRWNGGTWRRVPLPELPDLDLGLVDASAADNVWAFGSSLFERGPNGGGLFRQLRFDGTRWTVTTIDEDRVVFDVDVVNRNNVWLAGTGGYRLHGNLLHWNGRGWRASTLPGEVFGLHMTAASAGWAVGAASGRPATWRWNGTAWRAVPAPRYTVPNGGTAQLNDVLALSPTDAWAVGGMSWQVGDDEEHRPIALHWNGRRWSKVTVGPSFTSGLSGLAGDGRGGLWAQLDGTALLHYRAGGWSRVELPRVPDSDTAMSGGPVNVPGTRTMLGVGIAGRWSAPEGDKYDRVFFTGHP